MLVDDENLTDAIRAVAPEGLDAAIEFVGADALPQVLSVIKPGGISYGGDARDLPADALNDYLHAIADGPMRVVIAQAYEGLENVPAAHQDVERRHAPGKYVVVVSPERT